MPKRWFQIFGLFTILTLVSAVLRILDGTGGFFHIHLLLRFAVVALAVGSLGILDKLSHWPAFWAHAFHYAVTMPAVLAGLWVYGRFAPLHPDAYRDLFLNYTLVYIPVATLVRTWRRRKRAPGGQRGTGIWSKFTLSVGRKR